MKHQPTHGRRQSRRAIAHLLLPRDDIVRDRRLREGDTTRLIRKTTLTYDGETPMVTSSGLPINSRGILITDGLNNSRVLQIGIIWEAEYEIGLDSPFGVMWQCV